jgi:hypothetical protein
LLLEGSSSEPNTVDKQHYSDNKRTDHQPNSEMGLIILARNRHMSWVIPVDKNRGLLADVMDPRPVEVDRFFSNLPRPRKSHDYVSIQTLSDDRSLYCLTVIHEVLIPVHDDRCGPDKCSEKK